MGTILARNLKMKNPLHTPYQDLNQVLQELVIGIQEILKENFIGAYLQGSFAVGDFDQHSDVDFIVVIKKELSENEISALQELHGRIYSLPSPWAQHLEGSYFPKEILQNSSRKGEKLWYLDNGSRSLVQADHCNSIVVRWVVREQGVTLVGPPPRSLVHPIPVKLLRMEILDVITGWGQEILDHPKKYNNHFYQTFIVLSYCRMLHDLRAGFPGSKRIGAEWAKANLDPIWIGLINRTWGGRPNPEVSVRTPADPDDFRDTLKFVQYVINESQAYMIPE
jgi:predicted nucleotidyltransferase